MVREASLSQNPLVRVWEETASRYTYVQRISMHVTLRGDEHYYETLYIAFTVSFNRKD